MTNTETPMEPIPGFLRREREAIELAHCEVILKHCSRGPKGIIMKFEVAPDNYTAIMACLPLNEPMTMKLEKYEVGA